MRQLARAAYQLRIDIDRRDIIDNDGHAQAGAVREDMIEQCGLAAAKKAAEYGDREGGGSYRHILHLPPSLVPLSSALCEQVPLVQDRHDLLSVLVAQRRCFGMVRTDRLPGIAVFVHLAP